MKKNNLKEVPYYEGKPVWYDGYYSDEMRENKPFEETMAIVGFKRGCSSAKMIMKDTNGNEFEAFLKDAVDIIQSSINGIVKGRFCFVKRGANYGICLHYIFPSHQEGGQL